MSAAIAEVTTRFGTDVTVAFFPDKKRKEKQLRMYQKSMKDFMPVVSDQRDPHVHRRAAAAAAPALAAATTCVPARWRCCARAAARLFSTRLIAQSCHSRIADRSPRLPRVRPSGGPAQ
jgi:hypothetical protein